MSAYDFDEGGWDHDRQQQYKGRKHNRPMGPGNPHIPNKAERKELARIMQASGLTEEEVREDLTHRRALAKASKSMSQSPNQTNRRELAMKRRARNIAAYKNIPIWEAQKEAGLEFRESEQQRGRANHYWKY